MKVETNSYQTCSRNQNKQVPPPPLEMFSLKSCKAAPRSLQVRKKGGTTRNLGLSGNRKYMAEEVNISFK